MEIKWKKICSSSSCLHVTLVLALVVLAQELSSANYGVASATAAAVKIGGVVDHNQMHEWHGHCNGSIALCYETVDEMAMESETSRRFLLDTNSLTGRAVKVPDKPACNKGRSGQSYASKCLPPPNNGNPIYKNPRNPSG